MEFVASFVGEEEMRGLEAIAAAQRALAGPHAGLDAVLMDIFMPQMDGPEAARALRALYARSHQTCPPIIALTANAFPEDRAGYLLTGFDDYLAKPFESADLAALLERWAPLEGSSPAARPRPAA